MAQPRRTPQEEREFFDRKAESITKELPIDAYRAFLEAHRDEVNRQIIILELQSPRARAELGEGRLRHAAELIVWIRHTQNRDDDWRRPAKPKPPQPLTPHNGTPRILEDA